MLATARPSCAVCDGRKKSREYLYGHATQNSQSPGDTEQKLSAHFRVILRREIFAVVLMCLIPHLPMEVMELGLIINTDRHNVCKHLVNIYKFPIYIRLLNLTIGASLNYSTLFTAPCKPIRQKKVE